MISYHHVQYQKKVINQSWEDLVTDRQTDKQTDGCTGTQTDGQMDKSDFIGLYLTKVEHPKALQWKYTLTTLGGRVGFITFFQWLISSLN